jgi:hypothetical protein
MRAVLPDIRAVTTYYTTQKSVLVIFKALFSAMK